MDISFLSEHYLGREGLPSQIIVFLNSNVYFTKSRGSSQLLPWVFFNDCYQFFLLKYFWMPKYILRNFKAFSFFHWSIYPAGIYLLKINNKNSRTRCEICLKLTIKTPKRRQCRHSGVFMVNFEHISHLALVFLLLTLNM